MSALFTDVVAILAHELGVEPEDRDSITAESLLEGDLGADSLDQVSLVMAFEDAFELEIPDEVAESFISVGDVVAWLESQGAVRARAGYVDDARDHTGKGVGRR